MIADAWDELQRAAEAHTKSYDGPRTAAEQEERLKAAAIAYVRSLPMPSKGEWKPMPLDRVRFNAGVRCDMLIGACTCGATHDDRDPTQPAARGPSVAPMNRCARIVGPYQCGRLSCHTGACEFRDHTGHVVEAAPSSGVARDRARAFIEAEAITSEAYGADIIVVGRTFEDALVALLETETQVSPVERKP